MTVAAVILSATTEGALADTLGQPRVRRLVDIAWSGGALPVVVVAPDPEGAVAAAIVGSEAVYGTPAPPEAGPVGQMLRGAEVARAEVSDITGVLLWPGRMTWVGPETVTSLIELHGTAPRAVLRPTWDDAPGWPVLLPPAGVEALRSVAADRMPPDVIADVIASGLEDRHVPLGDPGVAFDRGTPRDELPAYVGPTEPAAGHVHEWGAAMAETSDDGPLEGPALAPYSPAAAEEPTG